MQIQHELINLIKNIIEGKVSINEVEKKYEEFEKQLESIKGKIDEDDRLVLLALNGGIRAYLTMNYLSHFSKFTREDALGKTLHMINEMAKAITEIPEEHLTHYLVNEGHLATILEAFETVVGTYIYTSDKTMLTQYINLLTKMKNRYKIINNLLNILNNLKNS